MKILHVITSLLSGGAEKLITDLLPQIYECGVDVELAVFNAIDTPFLNSLIEYGIKVHRFVTNESNVYSLFHLMKLNRLISNTHYDIVHAHNTPCQLFLSLCRKPKGTKFVTTEHNTFNRRRNIPILKYFDRAIYARYDRIICVSEAVKIHLTDFVGKHLDTKCLTIQNGITLEKFQNPFRHINQTEPIIVTMIAAFRKQKDHTTLLKAFALLPRNYRLRLVGEGETLDETKHLASKLGILDRTEFLGFSKDIPSVLANSHILVLSSHHEGLSLSCIECLSSGRPLIASDVPGLRDIVEDAGLLFKRGDSQDLGNKIETLSNNRSMYEYVTNRCQIRALDFDIRNTLQGYIKVYNQLHSDV